MIWIIRSIVKWQHRSFKINETCFGLKCRFSTLTLFRFDSSRNKVYRLVFAKHSQSLPICFSVILAHASYRLRNMKNKMEYKIEAVGLKRSPMGYLLLAMGQQEEKLVKIQNYLEEKLKDWRDFTHQRLRLGFVCECLSLNPSKVCFPVLCFLERQLVIWRALSLPQGISRSTQNLSGHFYFMHFTPLLCNVFLCTSEDVGIQFNESQKRFSWSCEINVSFCDKD